MMMQPSRNWIPVFVGLESGLSLCGMNVGHIVSNRLGMHMGSYYRSIRDESFGEWRK
jgi:hypothetical protein